MNDKRVTELMRWTYSPVVGVYNCTLHRMGMVRVNANQACYRDENVEFMRMLDKYPDNHELFVPEPESEDDE